jgi:hypothetical protein
MTIVVDSSQWTGQPEQKPGPIMWGEFPNEAARDAALEILREGGASRPGEPAKLDVADNAGQVEPPDEKPAEASQRNLRQGAVGMAMAGTAMAAAGLVIASGGALLPAVAAAAAAGTASGAVGEAIGHAAAPNTDERDREPVAPPASRGPVIGIHADDTETRTRAEALLREAGANRVFLA